MDNAYNFKDAAFALEGHAQERLENPFGGLHVAEISNDVSWMNNFETIKEGVVWRLVHTTGDESDDTTSTEEVVASLQGIICKKDLPPFIDKIGFNSSHTRYLRQSITLTGLNTPTFQSVTHNITQIHAMFGRAVGPDNLSQCGIVSQFREHEAVEISNRYFTPKKDSTDAQPIPLDTDIDPYGYLLKAAGTTQFYGEDNVVRYYESIPGKMSGRKFVSTKPIKFQIGDIVEAQVSFLLIPLRDKTFKSSMILRSLALLDGSHTQRASVSRLSTHNDVTLKAGRTLKRQVGYGPEEMASTRFRLSKLSISNVETVCEEVGWKTLLEQVQAQGETSSLD